MIVLCISRIACIESQSSVANPFIQHVLPWEVVGIAMLVNLVPVLCNKTSRLQVTLDNGHIRLHGIVDSVCVFSYQLGISLKFNII